MKKLNHYSIALLGMYGIAFTVMEYGEGNWHNWIEGFCLSFPVIFFIVFWSEKMSAYFTDSRYQPAISQFLVDFFLVHYALIFAFITWLVFQRHNGDAKAWWPLGILFNEAFGIVWGGIFAFFGLLLKRDHRRYTYTFSIATFLGYFIISLLPWPLQYVYDLNIWMLYSVSLFVFHLVFCLFHLRVRSRDCKIKNKCTKI